MISPALLQALQRTTLRLNPLGLGVVCALVLLVGGAVAKAEPAWQLALTAQTDPAKLATLGKRGANPHVNRIVFYLHEAVQDGRTPTAALDRVFAANGTTGLVASLSKETQLLNYQHAQDWGLLTPDNLEKLKRGQAPTISRGSYQGQPTDVDHIVPVSLAQEAGNSLANLELLPASVNRSKGDSVGWRELQFAGRLQAAGIIQPATLTQVRWAFVQGNVLPWLGLGAALVFIWFARKSRSASGRGLWNLIFSGLVRGSIRNLVRRRK